MFRRIFTWRRTVGMAALVAIAACSTYVLLAAVDLEFNKPGSAEPGQPVEDSSTLLTANRDRLAICVQVADAQASTQSVALPAVEAAMADLANHPVWIKKGYSDPPPVVQDGCPVGPALYDPTADDAGGGSFFDVRGRTVAQPSYFRLHVFVLSREEASRMGGSPGLTVEENVCSGDFCHEVTTGLYLTSDDIADASLVSQVLAHALGLQ